jgi:uncharacterized protein HemY
MKKIFITLCITFFFAFNSFCQMVLSDSLLLEINKTNNAKLLITLYQKLGTFYMTSKLKEAEAPLRKSLQLAKQEKDKNAIALAYCTLGNVYERQGSFQCIIICRQL